MSGRIARTLTDSHGPARMLPVRRLIQGTCLAGFLALFFWMCWPYGSKQYAEAFRAREIVDAELFLTLDPLVSVSTAIAGRMFVWSLAAGAGMMLVGVLLPRAFCGYVCPLGTLFDVFDRLIGRRGRPFGRWNHARFVLLAIVLVAAAFGVLLSGFVAAIPVLTRALLFVLAPVQTGFLKGWYLVPPANVGHVLSIVLIALMFALSLLGRRFWCSYLCPTGALLSLFSLLRLTERRLTGKCVKCGCCVGACSFAAVREDFSTRTLSCASCRACRGACPAGAIEFPWRWSGAKNAGGVDLSRRGVLAGLGGAAALGVGVPLAIGDGIEPRELPIRPPGSVPEDKFLQLCVRCGQCIKVCPNNVLQPAGFELGFNGLWTPKVVADWSGCEPSCNNCGQVCPTEAIRALSLEEKRAARIGLAEINCGVCLPHVGREACQMCVDECRMAGYNAIEFVRVGSEVDEKGEPLEGSGYLAPVVREDRCVGCGLCQMRCRSINVKSRKLLDGSAIRVVAGPGKEDRVVSGSYLDLKEERARQRQQRNRVEEETGGTEYLPDFLR